MEKASAACYIQPEGGAPSAKKTWCVVKTDGGRTSHRTLETGEYASFIGSGVASVEDKLSSGFQLAVDFERLGRCSGSDANFTVSDDFQLRKRGQ